MFMRVKKINCLRFLPTVLFLSLISFSLFSQSYPPDKEIDSLMSLLPTLNDSLKTETYNQISWKSRNINPLQAIVYGKKALQLAEMIQFSKGQTTALSFIGVAYRNLGRYNDALSVFQQAYSIADSTGDVERVGYSHVNIANIYYLNKDFKLAAEHLDKALFFAKEIKNENLEAYVYTNQARIYQDEKNFAQAIATHQKALELRQKAGDKYGTLVTFNKIGEIFREAGENEKAMEMFQKSCKIAKEEKQSLDIATAKINIAGIFAEKNDYENAKKIALEALEVAMQLKIALETVNAAKVLYQIEKKQGNHAEALRFHEILFNFRDTLLSDEKNKKLTELQIRFESEKKEQENQLLKKDQVLMQNIIEQQKIIVSGGIIIAVLLLVLLVFMFISAKKRKTANGILAQQKHRIEEQHKLVLEKNIELEHQSEMLRHAVSKISEINDEMHYYSQIVEAKNDSITAGLNYASRIQNALLAPKGLLKSLFSDSFIIFQPRDIVSGDFYFFEKTEHKIYLAAADCTGHGVPGALLSMLGMQGISEIVAKNPLIKPNELLRELDTFFIKSLQQHSTKTTDGMDIALLVYEPEKKLIEFSGARNPLIHVKKGEMSKLKSAKFSVGGDNFGREKEYPLHQIQLSDEKNYFFLYSDGFQDQFGGADNRKIMSKNFEKMLLEFSRYSCAEIEQKLMTYFEKWRGINTQTDDVLVIGICI